MKAQDLCFEERPVRPLADYVHVCYLPIDHVGLHICRHCDEEFDAKKAGIEVVSAEIENGGGE